MVFFIANRDTFTMPSSGDRKLAKYLKVFGGIGDARQIQCTRSELFFYEEEDEISCPETHTPSRGSSFFCFLWRIARFLEARGNGVRVLWLECLAVK